MVGPEANYIVIESAIDSVIDSAIGRQQNGAPSIMLCAMPAANPPHALRTALQGIAIFEALKGVAALLGLLGLLSLLHHDLHRLALELIGHFGLSPEARYPAVLITWVDRINASSIHTLVLLGAIYIALRWLEAWGLWHDKAWGEWLGALSAGLYIPLEVRHLLAHRHWQGALVLVLNLVLVAVLLRRLYLRKA
ncbi:uncharacterized membrane protein (DUF2068 family) [Comamonas odontotermitis]|uniref:Uncharacterized membrane protein (DUF2068 family) n=1 Tax=Comamonas odontotermitis TaxID=379895 RepID=A0ABR6RIC0_9BURK|nr:DUF2127 domain-containing protein [Comamonas odontotermitis]MBB6578901.1 uncharacterized membrane protein (DUF2068 family) [Comamonas odontotermitis]